MSMDVAIVGVGLHPFGRFGETTGIEMGAVAIRNALADAGVKWDDIQFAFAGSYEIDNPDAVVALLGLTGIPFTDVYNGCATAASALSLAAQTIRLGDHDLGIAVGMDKHPPGAFGADPRLYACPSWYGDVGQFVTTKFFGMKINKYMTDHGISASTLAKTAAKNYRNGSLNPNAFRRKPLSEDEILELDDAQLPAHAVHVLQSRRRRGGGRALQGGERAQVHRHADLPARARRCARAGSARSRCTARGCRSTRPSGRRSTRRAPAYEMAGIGPEDVDVIQLQDTDAGAEVIHLAENGFCADGEQEALIADGATEIDGPLPVNTDGGLIANGEPIGASGLRQIHEVVRQLRGQAGDRQVPGNPRVGYTQLYGAPGTAGVSILSLVAAVSAPLDRVTMADRSGAKTSRGSRSRWSMRMALPRTILRTASSSRPANIAVAISYVSGHVESVWG